MTITKIVELHLVISIIFLPIVQYDIENNDNDMKNDMYVINRHAIRNLQGNPKSDFQNAAGAMVHLY